MRNSRHTTATHLLRAGVDINTIRTWLVHVSIDSSSHAFLTVHQQGEESDVPTFKDVGEPESGFAVASKRTSSGTITSPDGSTRQHVSTWETEVTELSTAAIDPALFEIPSGFRLVERIRQEPVPPLVIRLKQAYERLVHARPRA